MYDFIVNLPILGPLLGFVLPFILVLSVVVFIHEYGHYMIARLCGIGAETFSVGFGPVLASWTDKRGTKWQVAAIPLGGFVRFLGDQNPASTQQVTQEGVPERAQFHLAPLWARSATVAAGPVFNFILSFVVFSSLVFLSGIRDERNIIGTLHPTVTETFDLRQGDQLLEIDDTALKPSENFRAFLNRETASSIVTYKIERDGDILTVDGPLPFAPIIGSVMPVSPAMKAGLQPDDLILSYAGQAIISFSDLAELVPNLSEDPYDMVILRDGVQMTIPLAPAYRALPKADGDYEERLAIGIFGGQPFKMATRGPTPIEAVRIGTRSVVQVLSESVNGIRQIVKGNIGVDNLQGPVGIAHVASDVAKSGWLDILNLIGFLSAAIGFLNLLPIPILDGGHLVNFCYEAIRGKQPNPVFQQYLASFTLACLLTMMLYITFNDVVKLILFG